MSAASFLLDFYNSFAAKLAVFDGGCSIAFGQHALPHFTKTKQVIVWPGAETYRPPFRSGDSPLQLCGVTQTVSVRVRAGSFIDLIRLKQLVFSAFDDAKEEAPFRNCRFLPQSCEFDERNETDAFWQCTILANFLWPLYYGEDDSNDTGVATSVAIDAIIIDP